MLYFKRVLVVKEKKQARFNIYYITSTSRAYFNINMVTFRKIYKFDVTANIDNI